VAIWRCAVVKKYSIAEARDNFTSVVHEAEGGATVELTRRGKPVAVLVGATDYERLSRKAPRFWEAYEKFRQEHDLSELGIDPDVIFADTRDRSPGRDFEW
jgi:prevent-host-death family protein